VISLGRAFVGAGVVLMVPGVLIALLLRLRLGILATWAAIPVFSLVTLFLLAEFTILTGAPFGVPAFLILILVLGCATFIAGRRGDRALVRRRPTEQDGELSSELRTGLLIARGLLVLGILIGVATWLRGLEGVPQLPPGADASRHGFMVARIEHV